MLYVVVSISCCRVCCRHARTSWTGPPRRSSNVYCRAKTEAVLHALSGCVDFVLPVVPQACPNFVDGSAKTCGKKVVESVGGFTCDKCGYNGAECDYRYRLDIQVLDCNALYCFVLLDLRVLVCPREDVRDKETVLYRYTWFQ